jgi:alkylation response protein AidB-like acyl-CoA dehydrogenase
VSTELALERHRENVVRAPIKHNDPLRVCALTEEVERWLGDPELESNTVSFVRSLESDERDEMPSAGIDRIRAFGAHRYFVPERLGGALHAADELLALARATARRDMNVAVSESTQLWMMLAWVGGDSEQQAAFARTALRGGVVPCLAYSERSHGADLASNEFLATPQGDSYVLGGEKFPINRGQTSTHVVLLGTTGDEATPAWRRQSMFLVDRSRLLDGTVSGLDREPTHGLRGCDISGVAMHGARVAASTRLGAEGEGLELALRGLLLTRTFCTALSLGAGDTMLRTVAEFVSDRTLYGGSASEIPYVSESLANAYVSLLVAECESLVAMRGLHLYLEEFSLWANFSKVQVARLVDGNASVLARILGARHYLRAPEHHGIFQKMLRDSAIVAVFDGSEPVCLDSIATQLPTMARAYGQTRDEDWTGLYDLRAELPEFEPSRTAVSGRGRDAVFASLPALLRMLDEVVPVEDRCDSERLSRLRALAHGLVQELDEVFRRVREARAGGGRRTGESSATGKATPTALLGLAEKVCSLHAKTAALGIWLHNRDQLGGHFADGEWLEVALDRAEVHRYEVGDLESGTTRRLLTVMREQMAAHEYFSILAIRQAAPGAAEAGTRIAGQRIPDADVVRIDL